MSGKSIYIECKCGHQTSGFKLLRSIDRLPPGGFAEQHMIEPLLPRLKCEVCGTRGEARIIWKDGLKTTRFLATANSLDRVFHRETCGWIGNVRADDEIIFKSAEAAIRRGYQPCTFCRPK